MEKIYLTSKELEQLPILSEGYESILYIYNNDYIIKVFKTDNQNILSNKSEKSKILTDIKSNDVLPIALVFIDGIYKGHMSNYRLNYKTLNSLEQKKKLKYVLLNKALEKIKYYNSLGIIIGDIQERNILFNPDNLDVILCDLDNSWINKFTFDFPNSYQRDYLKKVKVIDERIDSYMFNLFTVAYIQKVSYAYVLNFLETNGLEKELNSKDNQKLLNEVLFLRENFSGDLFINHRKKRILLP